MHNNSELSPTAVNHIDRWSDVIQNSTSPTIRSPVSKLSRMWHRMNDIPFIHKISSPVNSTNITKLTDTTLQNQHLLQQGFRFLSIVSPQGESFHDSKKNLDALHRQAIKTMESELANDRPLLIHCQRRYVMILLGYSRVAQYFSGYRTNFIEETNSYEDDLTYSESTLSYEDAKRAFVVCPSTIMANGHQQAFVYGFNKLDTFLFQDSLNSGDSNNGSAHSKKDIDSSQLDSYSPIVRTLPQLKQEQCISPIMLPKSCIGTSVGTSTNTRSDSVSNKLFVQIGSPTIENNNNFPLFEIAKVPTSPKPIVIDLTDQIYPYSESNNASVTTMTGDVHDIKSGANDINTSDALDIGRRTASAQLAKLKENSTFGTTDNFNLKDVNENIKVSIPAPPAAIVFQPVYTPPPPAPRPPRRSPARPTRPAARPSPRAPPRRTSPPRRASPQRRRGSPPKRRASPPRRAQPQRRRPVARRSARKQFGRPMSPRMRR